MHNYSNTLSNMNFDHVGIATESIEKGLKVYQAMGFEHVHIEVVNSEGVKVAMIQLLNGSKVELLEPLSEESPIAKFIAKKGEGIHHFCLETDNLQNVIENLKKEGLQLINEVPRSGAHGMQVVFIHPKSAGGVLLEIAQKS
jgi:methylmalonyl-CoA/ethylmalonyl-CoA epimerase